VLRALGVLRMLPVCSGSAMLTVSSLHDQLIHVVYSWLEVFTIIWVNKVAFGL